MPKGANQKLKLLYLMKILQERTDQDHALTLAQIIDALEEFGVSAERKSIYDDLEALRLYGLNIEKTPERTCGYYIADRAFELPELKLLVDAVQSSKFITYKKSNELIKKVEALTSRPQAQLLQRQVYVANRIKTMNESIYYNIDTIHAAISSGNKISYRYFEWAVCFSGSDRVRKQFRKNGERYCISPWALIWDDENYYMVGFDADAQMVKHYRVDKMEAIAVLDEPREGQEYFASFDAAIYAKGIFGMFGGQAERVRLRFANRLIGVVLDRFGKEVFLVPDGDGFFCISTDVVVSPQFPSWLFGFGDDVEVLSPPHVKKQLQEQAEKVLRLYAGKQDA